MENYRKKLLILDSTSMAGHMICSYLNFINKYDIVNIICDSSLANQECYVDVDDKQFLYKTIHKYNPDIIINCLRLLIDESEVRPDKAIYYNSYIPHYLSRIGKEINAKIIQLSTDCVFSGKKGGYNENDFKDGENYYARTKALGEIINERDLTLRTSFIGPNINDKNEELFHWFLLQKGEVNGYTKAFWTGITTLELAKSIGRAIEIDLRGLYHLVPKEKISKYDLLNLIKYIWNKNDVVIKSDDTISIDKSLIDNRKILETSSYLPMFEDLYNWMVINKKLYKCYFK